MNFFENRLIKLTILIIGKSLLAAAEELRGSHVLAQKFNIGEPGFSFAASSFTLHFTVSDFIDNNFVDIDLYSDEMCQNESMININDENSSYLDYKLSSLRKTGIGATTQVSDVTLNFDPVTIADSLIFTEDPLGASAIIRLCVRYNVLSAPVPDGVAANFLDTIIELTVDLADGFAIEHAVVESKTHSPTISKRVRT